MQATINYKNSTISYTVYGSGAELLLAFHGNGKNAASLQILEPYFGDRFTIVSVDIFYHGQSAWNEVEAPTKEEWKEMLQLILSRFGNPVKFSVFGYSIGGQLAVCTTYLFPTRVNTLWLTASTGIDGDMFYNFAVNTTVGRFFLNGFVKKPCLILGLLSLLKNTRLISSGLSTFAYRKIDTEEKRDLLYHRWMVLRNLSVKPRVLKQLVQENNIHVLLLFGKNDAVISHKTAIKFAKNLPNTLLLLPDVGHSILDYKTLKWLKERWV